MRISQQLGILTLSAIIVIVMVAVSAYYCLSLLTESHDAVQKSAEALEGTQEVCFHMAYASASQRAYIITGFDSSLDQYRAEVSNTRQTLENLSQSVKDKPAERELVGELGRGLNDRLASLENTLQIYETKGQQAAFARIKQGVGLAMMTHTVELANKLRDYELHQLLDGRKTAEINAKNTQLTIILGSILASAIVSISSLFFSRNLSNAVSSLLRASQNLAQERFESLVDIRNNNELGDLGRAFNVLAGHLKEKAKEADQAEQRRDKAEEELKNATAEIAQLRIQSAELAGLVQESKLEQELAAEHQKHLVDQVKDVASLSAMLSNLLQQVLDFSRDSRIAAETLDRRCLEMSEEMSKFGDQADGVSKSLDAIWNNLPETKDLVNQLDSVESELSVLSMFASMADGDAARNAEKVTDSLKELKTQLTNTKSKLNINVSHLQQMSRQALDSSSQFNSSLRGASRPMQAVSGEMARLLQPTLACRTELINVDRLCQRQVSALEQISKSIDLLDSSRAKQREFVARMSLKTGSVSAERNGDLVHPQDHN